jgi:hypothetical protein
VAASSFVAEVVGASGNALLGELFPQPSAGAHCRRRTDIIASQPVYRLFDHFLVSISLRIVQSQWRPPGYFLRAGHCSPGALRHRASPPEPPDQSNQHSRRGPSHRLRRFRKRWFRLPQQDRRRPQKRRMVLCQLRTFHDASPLPTFPNEL